MREIKFRAWNGEAMVSPDYLDRRGIAHWKEDSIPVSAHGSFVMQYTGLKDKNGVEIYEGDIVTQYYEAWNCGGLGDEIYNGEVYFNEGNFTVRPLNNKPAYYKGSLHYEKIEVIGNIYENPELLEEK